MASRRARHWMTRSTSPALQRTTARTHARTHAHTHTLHTRDSLLCLHEQLRFAARRRSVAADVNLRPRHRRLGATWRRARLSRHVGRIVVGALRERRAAAQNVNGEYDHGEQYACAGDRHADVERIDERGATRRTTVATPVGRCSLIVFVDGVVVAAYGGRVVSACHHLVRQGAVSGIIFSVLPSFLLLFIL